MKQLDPRLVSMAIGMARRTARRCPRSVLPEDLEQAALVGLLDGLRRHPDGSGPGWEFYLRCRMRGAIIDELRAQDWAGRRRGGKTATRWVHLEDVDVRWGESLSVEDETPEESTIRKLDAAKAWATPLAERDRRVMRDCYGRGHLHRDICAREGVSEPRITQLVGRALATMRSHLTGAAPSSLVTRANRSALWQPRGPAR